jgi:hypothetical protein
MASFKNVFPPLYLSQGTGESLGTTLSPMWPPISVGMHTLHHAAHEEPQVQPHPGEQEGEESPLRPRPCAESAENITV